MSNLITKPIHSGELPKIVLAELLGDESPEIEKPILYSWRINLEGSRKFAHVREVKVVFKFTDKEVSIREFAPKREQEERATLTINLIPNVASVSIPITDDKVTGRQTAEGVEWIFYDIPLPDRPVSTLSGLLVAEFQRATRGKKISVQMAIEPFFYGKKLFRSKSPTRQPAIESTLVSDHTKDIRPRDTDSPKLISDDEGIQDYKWERWEGILKKDPGIRNVALRTKTFSLLLSSLREKIPPEKYQKAMWSAGFKIGENFVEDMAYRDRELTPEEWSNYDAAAGMGRFSFYDKDGDITNDKDELQKIEVKNSFIAYGRHSNEPVCDFFCGYFEGGGLGKIYNEKFIVTEEECTAQGADFCVFKVRKAENT
jgi:predicted hydrocarbon binding protein